MRRKTPLLGVTPIGLRVDDIFSKSQLEKAFERVGFYHEVETIYPDSAVVDALCEMIGADVMITGLACDGVVPHVDDFNYHWAFGINVCLEGNHTFGEVAPRRKVNEIPVEKNTCFVVDHRVHHWFYPRDRMFDQALLLSIMVNRRDKATFQKVLDWLQI